MSNRYTRIWFALFLQEIDLARPEREATLVARWPPRPTYTMVARALAQRGYRATGIDL